VSDPIQTYPVDISQEQVIASNASKKSRKQGSGKET